MTLLVEEMDRAPNHVLLREADAAECNLLLQSPLETVTDSFERSLSAYRVTWNGEPLAYWGFAPTSVLGSVCWAWMLTTPVADRVPLMLALGSKRVLAHLHSLYPTVLIHVDPAHQTALRWLEWLGFNIHRTAGPFLQMRADREGYASWGR